MRDHINALQNAYGAKNERKDKPVILFDKYTYDQAVNDCKQVADSLVKIGEVKVVEESVDNKTDNEGGEDDVVEDLLPKNFDPYKELALEAMKGLGKLPDLLLALAAKFPYFGDVCKA